MNIKVYTVRNPDDKIICVGTVSEILMELNINNPTSVYNAIHSQGRVVANMIVTESTEEELLLRGTFDRQPKKIHIPVPYRDSHSVRFTPL